MAKKTVTPMRRSSRRDFGDAFLPDPSTGEYPAVNDAESFGEEFIAGATSAEYVGEDSRNELSMDELGGPFLTEAAVLYDDI